MKNRFFWLFIFIIIVLLFLLVVFKLSNIYTYRTSFLLSSYQGFEIDGDTIIKYNNSGGNVVIPSSINGVVITEIGNNAFNGLNIESIIIPNTITSIGDYAFANNNLSTITLPDSLNYIGEGAFIHNNISNIEFNSDVEFGNACFNDNLLDYEDAFFYRDGELISYGGKIRGNVEVNNDLLTTIGEKAFLETYIVSISLPNSVNVIKSEAFKGNYLVELYLSSNILDVAIDAFEDNNYLSEIVIDKELNSLLNYPWGAEEANLYWTKK